MVSMEIQGQPDTVDTHDVATEHLNLYHSASMSIIITFTYEKAVYLVSMVEVKYISSKKIFVT